MVGARWLVGGVLVVVACGGGVRRDPAAGEGGAGSSAGQGGSTKGGKGGTSALGGSSAKGGTSTLGGSSAKGGTSTLGGSSAKGGTSTLGGQQAFGGDGGAPSEAGAAGEDAGPIGGAPPDLSAPCVKLGPEDNPLEACAVENINQCPAGFSPFTAASTALPVCVKGNLDFPCWFTTAVVTWAYQHAQHLEPVAAPRQRLVDVNSWPFCQEQEPYVPGDQVSGVTATAGEALTFHALVSRKTSLVVEAASAPLRVQVFDERCAPLFTSALLPVDGVFQPALDPGRYVFLVLSATESNAFTLGLSGGSAGPREPMSPIWELRPGGYEQCVGPDVQSQRRSQCVDGWGAMNILTGPPITPPSYDCTDSAYYQVPACAEPDAVFAIVNRVRMVPSRLPEGLTHITLEQVSETPPCPTCRKKLTLLRPSPATGVPFADVGADSLYGAFSTSALGSYRVTGIQVDNLPANAQAAAPSWSGCGATSL